eukprot:g4448.t1
MGQKQWKGVSYDPDGVVKSCLFCRIAQKRMKPGRDGKGELLYEDEDVVVFKPREPMATMHILAVPKRHIKTVRNLTDQELLEKMLIAGSFVLDREESSDCAVGKQKSVTDILRDPRRYYRFHVPPFNSIDHGGDLKSTGEGEKSPGTRTRPRRSAAIAATNLMIRGSLAGGDSSGVKGKSVVEQLAKLLVGQTVEKEFPGFGTFVGQVDKVTLQGKNNVWIHVKYEDGDEEDLTCREFLQYCKGKETAERLVQITGENNWSSAADSTGRGKRRSKPSDSDEDFDGESSNPSEDESSFSEDDMDMDSGGGEGEEFLRKSYFRTPNKVVVAGTSNGVKIDDKENDENVEPTSRTPLRRMVCEITKDINLVRCKKAKGRALLPKPRKSQVLSPEHLGDAVMIWTTLHTFNSNPRIADKSSRGLFPVIVLSPFTLEAFVEALQWSSPEAKGDDDDLEKTTVHHRRVPPNLLSEIHMALLYPLLLNHSRRQTAALNRKGHFSPAWLVSSAQFAIDDQDSKLFRLDRIRWQAIMMVMMDQYAVGPERELLDTLKSNEYCSIDVSTRLRMLEWLIGCVVAMPHVAEAITTSTNYIRTIQRDQRKQKVKQKWITGRTAPDEAAESELAERFQRFPPTAMDRNHNRFWTSSQLEGCYRSCGSDAPSAPFNENVFAEDGITGKWYCYSDRADLLSLKRYLKRHGKRKQNRRQVAWWEAKPNGLNALLAVIDVALNRKEAQKGAEEMEEEEHEEEEGGGTRRGGGGGGGTRGGSATTSS